MNFISSETHGFIDYVFALLLIGAPYVLGFSGGGAPQWTFWLLGTGIIGLALLTDFKLGLVHLVPMQVHLGIDILGGLFLAASPWLLGFAEQVWTSHVVFGLLEAGFALITQTTSVNRPTAKAV